MIQAAKGMPSKLLLYMTYIQRLQVFALDFLQLSQIEKEKKITVMNKFIIHAGARENEQEDQ